MQEIWVQSLGSDDPLEEDMANYSSILAQRTPWIEKPGRLQSMGSQRVGHNWATKHTRGMKILFFLFKDFQKMFLTSLFPVGSEIHFPSSKQYHWIIEKARESRKTSTSASCTIVKPLTMWITTNCGKFLKRWDYQTTLSVSWESCMQVKKQQLEPDMEQQTGSKLGKKHIKSSYCHPAYLTSMQSTSCKMPGWMDHKLKWRLLGEITTSDVQVIPL